MMLNVFVYSSLAAAPTSYASRAFARAKARLAEPQQRNGVALERALQN